MSKYSAEQWNPNFRTEVKEMYENSINPNNSKNTILFLKNVPRSYPYFFLRKTE